MQSVIFIENVKSRHILQLMMYFVQTYAFYETTYNPNNKFICNG